MTEYPKIPGPFKRYTEGPSRNKFIIGEWSSPELKATANLNWVWTEKVDGTNIRIIWDGHKVVFGGRTDNAQLPAKLVQYLNTTFTEELLEQAFTDTPAMLYGEGYGAGIQSGGLYRPDQAFILFDVKIGGWWLRRPDVEDIAASLGIDVVPKRYSYLTIPEAIGIVANPEAPLMSRLAASEGIKLEAEGLVGTTEMGLLDRSGQRLIVKLKRKDFAQ